MICYLNMMTIKGFIFLKKHRIKIIICKPCLSFTITTVLSIQQNAYVQKLMQSMW